MIDIDALWLRGEGDAAIDENAAPFAFDVKAVHADLAEPSEGEDGERFFGLVFSHLESRAHRAEFFDHEIDKSTRIGREVPGTWIDELEITASEFYVGKDADEPAGDVLFGHQKSRAEADPGVSFEHLPHEPVRGDREPTAELHALVALGCVEVHVGDPPAAAEEDELMAFEIVERLWGSMLS